MTRLISFAILIFGLVAQIQSICDTNEYSVKVVPQVPPPKEKWCDNQLLPVTSVNGEYCVCKPTFVRNRHDNCVKEPDCVCNSLTENIVLPGTSDTEFTCFGQPKIIPGCAKDVCCVCKSPLVRDEDGECVDDCKCDCDGQFEELLDKTTPTKYDPTCDGKSFVDPSCLGAMTKCCYCLPNYVRDEKGECVKANCCPKPCGCTSDEVVKPCNQVEEEDCYGNHCIKQKPCKTCPNKCCTCDEDYVRDDNGNCIPKSDCPCDCGCGDNQEVKDCNTFKDTDCNDDTYKQKHKCKDNPKKCCACEDGFVRNSVGDCVLRAHCPDQCGCGANQIVQCCKDAKDMKCSGKPFEDLLRCKKDKTMCCVCDKGFFRNHEGKCVPKKDCPQACGCGNNQIVVLCKKACEKDCDGEEYTTKQKCTTDPKKCCVCQDGYVRDSKGNCIKECDCEDQCKCGAHEEVQCCLSVKDKTCCGDIYKKIKCPNNPKDCCACEKGYVRDENGKCIPECDCPQKCKCKDHEKVKPCKSFTDKTCCGNDYLKKTKCKNDPKKCCACEDGYVRDEDGNCIPECECPDKCGCDDNEMVKDCTYIEKDCDDKIYKKKNKCHTNPKKCCVCKKGYVRNKDGKCILKDDCNKGCDCCKNEEEKYCKSFTDKDCDGNNCTKKKPCKCDKKKCCACKKGFVRDENGDCIPKNDCPKCDDESHSNSNSDECSDEH